MACVAKDIESDNQGYCCGQLSTITISSLHCARTFRQASVSCILVENTVFQTYYIQVDQISYIAPNFSSSIKIQ